MVQDNSQERMQSVPEGAESNFNQWIETEAGKASIKKAFSIASDISSKFREASRVDQETLSMSINL